ncbi:uncharacterized protein METZ01_LOCUS277505, partial [marine metagenome]
MMLRVFATNTARFSAGSLRVTIVQMKSRRYLG